MIALEWQWNFKMEDALKKIAFSLALFFLALSFCTALDTPNSLKDDLQNAQEKKALGVRLTIGGGVTLIGTYVFYVADAIYIGISEDSTSSSSSEMAGKMGAWVGITAIGATLGICGLAFGIPDIIVGSIREHQTQGKIDAWGKESQTDITLRPTIAISPSGDSLALGFSLSY
jgi:hypothetical protein